MLEMRPVDVLNNLKGWGMWPQSYHLSESEAQTCIQALEDAVNKPKTGHWVYTGDYQTDGMLKCSECGEEIDVSESYYDFCPVCGAKMIEPQESEDKE